MPKDFDAIMTGITAKLTGDPKHDIPYLTEQIKEHSNDEYGQEIGRACARIIAKTLPKDVRENVYGSIDRLMEGTRQAVEEAQFNIYRKDFQRAVDILDPVIRKYEASGFLKDDKVMEYKSFDSTIEFIIYIAMYSNPEKEVKNMGPDLYMLYSTQASALYDLGRHGEAILTLEKARKLNPINPSLAYEMAMNYESTDMEKYAEYTRLGLKHSYTGEYLARGLRNLGYYYSDKEMFEAAAACYVMSMEYVRDSSYAQGELYYIQQRTGEGIPKYTPQSMRKMAEKYYFPMKPNDDIVEILYGFGRKTLEDKLYGIAKDLFEALYSMIPADELRELLDLIPEEND